MAGIGFQLRRLTTTRTFIGVFTAYASAAAISAGPWIISIISLMVLTWLLHQTLPGDQIRLFTASVTHVYAFALILTGPIQIILTRYTADCLSLKQTDRIFPSFKGGILLASSLSALAGGYFFFKLVPSPPMFAACAAGLLVYVSCIFIASVYLSALRKYYGIVLAFAFGYGFGVIAAWRLAISFGITGAMAGLLIGHLVLLGFLAICIRREIRTSKGSSFAFVRGFVKFPDLMLCGLFYNLGIWIDKFLFWWLSQSRVQVAGALYAAPDYDLAIYLSLLSIAPGMAVFILQVETDFSEKFHTYFKTVNQGGTMSEVIRAKSSLILSLRAGFNRLLKVQGITTALLVIYANELTSWFHVSFIQVGIFRITLFGTFLLVMFLAMLTVLFYFNDRKGALLCSFVFLLSNGLLSAITVMQNEAWYGFGFVVASGLALFIAAARVNSRLDHLEYHTFRIQPA